jgi:hypothetical protein
MSTVTFCDLCGVDISYGSGKGNYRIDIQTPDQDYRDRAHFDLCVKCFKPITQWRRTNPKRKMVPAEA